MIQTSFFPIKITHEEPFTASADLKLVGYTRDKVRYAIKRKSDEPLLPAAEWLGHCLCRLAGIATPDFAVVECINGEYAFGSRWEEAAEQISASTSAPEKLLLFSSHTKDIAAIHALDRIYANTDRHAGNYLFVTRAGSRMALAMDFSRAGPLAGTGPFGHVPLPESCATIVIAKILKNLGHFDQTSYLGSLNQIGSVEATDLSKALDAAPSDWFDTLGKVEILDWWDNSSSARISQARQ